PHKVLDMVFDLFVELKATDEQLDFPIVYASAKNGFAMRELHDNNQDMTPLFEAIVQQVPPPKISTDPFFQMLVSNLDYSDYLGGIALGRIVSGRVAVGDSIVCIHRDGHRERAAVTALFTYAGLEQVEIKHAAAGDIIEITARGEMQIAILVEQMRREGYEVMVSRPEVIFHRAENGNLLEPLENLYVDLPSENLGDILQSVANRKGEVVSMDHHATRVSIEAIIPTRGLIGFETDLLNLTRGEGLMSHLFREYAPFKGEIGGRGRGAMVSMESGVSMA